MAPSTRQSGGCNGDGDNIANQLSALPHEVEISRLPEPAMISLVAELVAKYLVEHDMLPKPKTETTTVRYRLWTIDDVADFFQVHRATVHKWRREDPT